MNDLARIAPPDYPPIPKPDEDLATMASLAYSDFMDAYRGAKESKSGVPVGNKRVRLQTKKLLLQKALTACAEQFSLFELVRLMGNKNLTMDAYLQTLVSIRDDPAADPKSRMAANDRIQQFVYTLLKVNCQEREYPDVEGSPLQVESATKNLLEVMHKVRDVQQVGETIGTIGERVEVSTFPRPGTPGGDTTPGLSGCSGPGGSLHGGDVSPGWADEVPRSGVSGDPSGGLSSECRGEVPPDAAGTGQPIWPAVEIPSEPTGDAGVDDNPGGSGVRPSETGGQTE